MSRPNNLMLLTASALAMTAIMFPAFVKAASNLTVATTDLSAQAEDPKKKKTAPAHVAPRQAPARVAPKQVAPRTMERHVTPQGGGQKNIGVQKKLDTQKKLTPVTTTPQVGGAGSGGAENAKRVFTPRSANSRIVSAARIRGVPARGVGRTSIGGRNYSVWRSGYRVRRGGDWRTFVALGALGALTIGAIEYYPYAYVEAPENYCDGMTEDGCQLFYDVVDTMEGGSAGQCVAYCPQQ